MRKVDEEKIYRLMDANFNRAKEGLRVCEDVARFIFDNKKVTGQYKAIRHTLESTLNSLPLAKKNVIRARNIQGDVGRASILPELRRRDVKDIFFSNSQRVKESLRVLEEFLKLVETKYAQEFKAIRYKVYALERDIVKEF